MGIEMPLRIVISSILVLVAMGCEKADSRDQIMREGIDAINEIADMFDTVKDEASANALKPKINDFRERIEALSARAAKLPEPSESEQQALKDKYLHQMNAAADRLGQSTERIAKPDMLPYSEPIVMELLAILRKVPIAAKHNDAGS